MDLLWPLDGKGRSSDSERLTGPGDRLQSPTQTWMSSPAILGMRFPHHYSLDLQSAEYPIRVSRTLGRGLGGPLCADDGDR
jgi:hypothetical protein